MMNTRIFQFAFGALAAFGALTPLSFAGEAPVASISTGASTATAPAGRAIKAAKILLVPVEGPQVLNHGVVLIKDGKIEAVGPARTTAIPAGYDVVDIGDRWLMPGFVDLHSHIAGTFDINDTVYLTNPGVRAYTSVIPQNANLSRGVAGGVTTILFIPGSGSNVGGEGVLLKTWRPTYEEMQLRKTGSLKLAQAGNPEGYIFGIARSFMNWHTRNTFTRGAAYAKRWQAFENGTGPEPKKDIQFEVFRKLMKNEAQVSTHTQMFQVVSMTIRMIKRELGIPVYIDHGTFDGWRAGGLAEEAGVPAILGPRNIDVPTAQFIRWTGSNPERIQGVAAGYQEMGHTMIGFNTDAPVIPQEELFLQSSMAVRYGFDSSNLEHIRGLTIVPALAAGIESRVGSIEAGKDADLLVLTGDPADPRTAIDAVYIEGHLVYDTESEMRRW